MSGPSKLKMWPPRRILRLAKTPKPASHSSIATTGSLGRQRLRVLTACCHLYHRIAAALCVWHISFGFWSVHPFPIHHEAIFVPADIQGHVRVPFHAPDTSQRRRLGVPLVKATYDIHLLCPCNLQSESNRATTGRSSARAPPALGAPWRWSRLGLCCCGRGACRCRNRRWFVHFCRRTVSVHTIADVESAILVPNRTFWSVSF